MILVSIACIAGTGFLWYTYIDIKYNLDKVPRSSLLLESVRNETAFLWYAIIATVITVSVLNCSHHTNKPVPVCDVIGYNIDPRHCDAKTS